MRYLCTFCSSFLCTLLAAAGSLLLTGCPTAINPPAPPIAAVDESEPLEDMLDRVLAENLQGRRLSTEKNGAWQILHGLLAYGADFEIETPEGEVSALDYLLRGGKIDGFDPRPGDELGDPPRRGLRMELEPSTKVGQGHRDQWLAILAQCGLAEEISLRADGREYRIADWVRQVEHDIPLNLEAEFSWTLIGLLTYRPTDHRWTARDGQSYDVALLLEAELSQSLPESACGGTHRLNGMAMSLTKRRAEGRPVEGVWAEAQRVIDEAIEMARQNQNPDGSYSVEYHHRTGWTRDLGETLGTTGHVVEFLTLAADDETLRQPWVERSVRRLCAVLDACRGVDLECGVLYHALHGLQEYRSRITSSPISETPSPSRENV